MASGRTARRVPRPLVLLLACTFIVNACWALVTPAWQSPDEGAHFGYVQTLAEDGRLPNDDPGPTFSTEQRLGERMTDFGRVRGNPQGRPQWSPEVSDRFRDLDTALPASARGDGGGDPPGIKAPNPARINPPLYYSYEAVPYFAAPGGGLFDGIYLMRLWSGLLLLVAVTAAWLLVGEIFSRRRDLQLVGASFVAFVPMANFIASSINPDAGLIAGFALAFWLGARVIRRGLTLATGVALCAVTAATILCKATGYALVPPVLLALAVGAWRAGMLRAAKGRLTAVAPLFVLAVPVAAWVAYTRSVGRDAINTIGVVAPTGGVELPAVPNAPSYLWQFYLPQLPGMQPLPETFPRLPLWSFWVEGGWGTFGWLEVPLPNALYVVAAAVTAALAIGAGVAVVRAGLRRHWAVLLFLAGIAACLLAGIHYTEFRYLERHAVPFAQGRYLLPLLPLLGLAAAATVSVLRGRWRAVAAGALIGGLIAIQIASLAVVTARFYA
jgi:4-amino-4-deoxy-L-arabinose transferase-like glycosyltransferase